MEWYNLPVGLAAEKVIYFVIPNEARNLSWICPNEKKVGFLASLGMTKSGGPFSAACSACVLLTSASAKIKTRQAEACPTKINP
jgi:hypothetical protein